MSQEQSILLLVTNRFMNPRSEHNLSGVVSAELFGFVGWSFRMALTQVSYIPPFFLQFVVLLLVFYLTLCYSNFRVKSCIPSKTEC